LSQIDLLAIYLQDAVRGTKLLSNLADPPGGIAPTLQLQPQDEQTLEEEHELGYPVSLVKPPSFGCTVPRLKRQLTSFALKPHTRAIGSLQRPPENPRCHAKKEPRGKLGAGLEVRQVMRD
jgi:hypothetical protein